MYQMSPRPATPCEALLMQQNNMLFQENYPRSQNERALYAALKNAVEENKNLDSLITTLNEQMQVLRYETENLKKNIQAGKRERTYTEYFTDED